MVHHDLGPIVRSEACTKEVSRPQIGLGPVKERTVVQHVAHPITLWPHGHRGSSQIGSGAGLQVRRSPQ